MVTLIPGVPDADIRELFALYESLTAREGCAFNTYFPDAGPLRRELYPRSLLFWLAGTLDRERMMMAANRCSKTVTAAFEMTSHLTGLYKPWWPGRTFEGPIEAWAAGDTLETTRDIIQNELCGPRQLVKVKRFAGMIPPHLILDRSLKSGSVSECIDTLWIKHRERHHGAPCTSVLQFKAFNQGRLSFQGTSKHLIWLDEEPPEAGDEAPGGGGTPSGNGDVVTECLLRTATTNGLLMLTLTPLRGLTPFLESCLERGVMVDADGAVINAKVGMFGAAA